MNARITENVRHSNRRMTSVKDSDSGLAVEYALHEDSASSSSLAYGIREAVQRFQCAMDVLSPHMDDPKYPGYAVLFEVLAYLKVLSDESAAVDDRQWPQVEVPDSLYAEIVRRCETASLEDESWGMAWLARAFVYSAVARALREKLSPGTAVAEFLRHLEATHREAAKAFRGDKPILIVFPGTQDTERNEYIRQIGSTLSHSALSDTFVSRLRDGVKEERQRRLPDRQTQNGKAQTTSRGENPEPTTRVEWDLSTVYKICHKYLPDKKADALVDAVKNGIRKAIAVPVDSSSVKATRKVTPRGGKRPTRTTKTVILRSSKKGKRS